MSKHQTEDRLRLGMKGWQPSTWHLQLHDELYLLLQFLSSVVRNCSRFWSTGQLKCDGTRAETRFPLSAKRSSPFKSAGRGGASVQSTTGSRGVRISGSNAGYTMFRGSVKSTGYPLHSPVSPSLPLPCVTVWHHISTGVYKNFHIPFKPETYLNSLYLTDNMLRRHYTDKVTSEVYGNNSCLFRQT